MKNIVTLLLIFVSSTLAAQNYTVISNANVIDVRSGKILPGTSVLIKDGVIQEVFTNKRYKLPPNTIVVDGAGKYVMPGMTDAHIHFFQSGGLYARPDAFNFTSVKPYSKEREFTFNNTTDYFRRYLRLGITTVADVGGPMSNFAIRDSISRKSTSPTVLVTGPLFSMVEDKPLDNGDAPIIKTTTIEAADALLDKLIPLKPDYIKIWYIVTPELPAEKTFPVVQHIAKRTHAAKLKLAVHATELKTADLAVDAGADILVHSVDDEVLNDAFIKKLVANKVSYIPTLVVARGYYATAAGVLPNHPNDLAFANPMVYVSLSDVEHLRNEYIPKNIQGLRKMKNPNLNAKQDSISYINLKKAFAAGVNIVAGTDAGNIGTMHASSFLIELEEMKKADLTNAQILKTATLNSAMCFGQNSGTLEKGKAADLVVLSGNPLDNLSVLSNADYVMKAGVLLKTDTLIRETPEMLIQRQINAYNAKDTEAFLATYADDVELYDFPNTLTTKGKDKMREIYGKMFKELDYLHCEITERVKLGNTIVDHERVKFNTRYVDAIAIYEVKDGKIVRVTFKD